MNRNTGRPSGQPMRTALMRRLVRVAVKPFFSPTVPVTLKRQGLWLATRTARPAPGTGFVRTTLNDVPVERVSHGDAADRAILYLHGGAYFAGSPATHRAITSRLARDCGAIVHALDYRLAPEYPFPAALDDALAGYRALLASGQPPEKIVLVGDSAGGGLALATALAAREEGLPPPSRLVLFSPWVDLTLANAQRPSPREHMLSWAGLRHAARLYAPGDADHPLASPLHAELRGLPPVLVQTGSEEILLAESQQLCERARHAGVDIKLTVFDGMWHVFQAHAGFLDAADRALADVAAFIARQPKERQ